MRKNLYKTYKNLTGETKYPSQLFKWSLRFLKKKVTRYMSFLYTRKKKFLYQKKRMFISKKKLFALK